MYYSSNVCGAKAGTPETVLKDKANLMLSYADLVHHEGITAPNVKALPRWKKILARRKK